MTMTIQRPSHTRLSDDRVAAMVQSAATGDQRGWDALVREFGGLVWAIARAHQLSHTDAADVAQATWVALLEHLDDLGNPARVAAWLATTARRQCLRVLRARARCVPFDVQDGAEPQSPEQSPLEQVLTTERDVMLWRAFVRLSARDQALLRLLTADSRPGYQEISAALDMPIGSIGPTRGRALERLRRELDRQAEVASMTD